MIYARKLRHYSRRDHFHLANFAPRFRFTVNVEVFSNRILNTLERLPNVCSLRMASWQFRATYRNAFVMFDERYVKFRFTAEGYALPKQQSTVLCSYREADAATTASSNCCDLRFGAR